MPYTKVATDAAAVVILVVCVAWIAFFFATVYRVLVLRMVWG